MQVAQTKKQALNQAEVQKKRQATKNKKRKSERLNQGNMSKKQHM